MVDGAGNGGGGLFLLVRLIMSYILMPGNWGAFQFELDGCG